LSSNCQTWLKACLENLKQGVSDALKYATNLKSLGIIRDAVIEFETKLKASSSGDSNESISWETKCESLLKQKLEIWTDLVSPFYYLQSKVNESE
jgi:hypothetical protein